MAKTTKDPIQQFLDQVTANRSAAEVLKDGGLLKELKRRLIETALNAEMTEHLGYEKHSVDGIHSGNSRNGTSSKTLLDADGNLQIAVPRDRQGEFEPLLVRKRQVRLPGFDEKVLALYSRGMTTRQIQDHLLELYDVEISPTLITTVTDAVLDEVRAWQSRPLDPVYPVVFLDALHVKVRSEGRVRNRAVYVALAIDLSGQKQLLGLWIGEAEGAQFWLGVLTELKNRGVDDILIASVDGLTGFPAAIASVFPQTEVQLCMVHLVRNSLRYVPWKDREKVAKDMRAIYQAPTEEAAAVALENLDAMWSIRYPLAARPWRTHWDHIIPLFRYPAPIRRVIYTTNAVESLNAQLRSVTKKRGAFPTDDSLRKVLYLAMTHASKRWTMPLKDWSTALNFLSIAFQGRVPLHE